MGMGILLDRGTVTTYSVALTRQQGTELEQKLRDGTWKLREVAHARVSGRKGDVDVTLYESGKMVVQGKGTREFLEFVLEPEILREAKLGYEEPTPSRPAGVPRIGVDESGKGDFFGPMCIAGVYVNPAVTSVLAKAGVRDSKSVGSDREIGRLADIIRGTAGCVVNVVTIGNEAYNRMHRVNGSVNRILAWGHARVIENLMALQYQMSPPPQQVVCDQFASDKDTIERALMGLGRKVAVIQRHKAETDIAVAAASIVARWEFVRRLEKLGETAGVPLPKGASAAVIEAGRKLVAARGGEALGQFAKLHFRTTHFVMGTKPPPKTEWSKPGARRTGDSRP
jgi:ribonuclease HIII